MRKTLSNVTIKDADQGLVTAVFSTFNVVDKDGDVTLPGAIKDGAEVVISAYGHGSWDGRLPVGKGVIRTTDTEAILEGAFFMDTTHGSDTFKTVKALGPMGEWSYSLQNVKSHRGELDGKAANFLESIDVKETSPVLAGAGVNTRTLETKGLKFSEEGETVLAALVAYLGRAKEVMVLRAEKGRTISDDTAEILKGIDGALSELRDLLTTKADESAEGIDTFPEDLAAIADSVQWDEIFSSLTGV